MNRQTLVTVVSHTHWDRAWYVTFQEFRVRLVRLVDRLIDLLTAQPDYPVFMLDGQMAVLEDYLEVRPQREAELQALCRQGRLKVGPWYVLADEFLVSPEALIRNLALGHRMGEKYGGVANIGYVPDGFGHIAQLPQILRGFGIDNAFFWRGLGSEGERLGTEFTWQAPDGSSVTAIWMPWGYHNLSNLGYPIHWGDTSQMAFSEERGIRQIQQAIARLKPMGHTRAVLLMNGIDHEEAEPRVPRILKSAAEQLEDCSITQGSLEDHLNRVRLEHPNLPEFSGEFRWGRYSEILQGVYSTRIQLKQANHQVENLLERYAEPLAALAWLSAVDVPQGVSDLLGTAWRWLLKNHPHDDIYGSGVDAVHDEMRYRFDQARQIGEVLVRDSLRQLGRQVNFSGQSGMPLLVFNPLNWARDEMLTGDIDFDLDDPTAGRFQIVDGEGTPVPHQVLGDQPAFWMETLKANRKRRVRVVFPAQAPSCGYRAYYVKPAESRRSLPNPADWAIYPAGAANRYLSFTIQADGGLSLLDKSSGKSYEGLNHLEDVDDAGDEYSYSPCENSRVITTHGQPAAIKLLASGPNLATFVVKRILHLPVGLTPDRKGRSERLVSVPVVTRLTLYRDRPGLFVETEVDNRARDHKLSAVFPSGLHPQQAMVDASFAVLPRPLDLPDSTAWVEDPTPLMHQRAFTDLSEGGRGLAVFNRGLPSVEVSRGPQGASISLTLLRCVGWLSRDDLSTRRVAAGPVIPAPGAQCPGKYLFQYVIFPHNGDWQSVYRAAYAYISPLMLARADTHEGLDLKEMNITRDDPGMVRPIPWPRSGPLPDTFSVIAVDRPELVLSSLARSTNQLGIIARLYNVAAQTVTCTMRFGAPLRSVWKTNLKEEPLESLELSGDRLSCPLAVRGGEIVTLLLIPLMNFDRQNR